MFVTKSVHFFNSASCSLPGNRQTTIRACIFACLFLSLQILPMVRVPCRSTKISKTRILFISTLPTPEEKLCVLCSLCLFINVSINGLWLSMSAMSRYRIDWKGSRVYGFGYRLEKINIPLVPDWQDSQLANFPVGKFQNNTRLCKTRIRLVPSWEHSKIYAI